MIPASESLLRQIEQQKHLSDKAGQAILTALSPIYYPDIPSDKILFGEIGSYGRGTILVKDKK